MVRAVGGLSRERQQKHTLGVLVVGVLVGQGILGLLFIALVGAYIGLVRKEPPTLVQLEQGRTIRVEPIDTFERTPATIQKFVQDTMMLLMSSSGQLPASGETPASVDPGVEVQTEDGTRLIATLASMASFGLSSDFRVAFTAELGRMTPQEAFRSSGGTQVVLMVRSVSEPEPIETGKWKVTMIADLITFNERDRIGTPRPFNKEIFVQSTLAPPIQPYSSPLEQQIAQVRSAGLEIYAIRNYVAPNL